MGMHDTEPYDGSDDAWRVQMHAWMAHDWPGLHPIRALCDGGDQDGFAIAQKNSNPLT